MSKILSMAEAMRTNAPMHRLPAQISALPDGRLLIRGAAGIRLVRGVDPADLEQVLSRVDGDKSADAICSELAEVYDPDAVLGLLRHLEASGLVSSAPTAAEICEPQRIDGASKERKTTSVGKKILVLGEGLASRRIAERLAAPRRATPRPSENLARHLRQAELVICALEETTYDALFEIQRSCLGCGIACLILTFDPDGVRLGPTVVPGDGPCFACAQIASLRRLGLPGGDLVAASRRFALGRSDAATSEAIVGEAIKEARAILAVTSAGRDTSSADQAPGQPSLLSSVAFFPRGGSRRTYAATPAADCPLCRRAPGTGHPLAAQVRRELIDNYVRSPRRARVSERETLCTSVGILGGGTAGYLTALALRRKQPALDVTLIEASEVPIIGVGEATTPLMPQFLHVDLGFDVDELFRHVDPTLKLGIRFEWGEPGGAFNYPFGPVHLLESTVYDGDILRCSPQSLLMSNGSLPIEPEGDRWHSALGVDAAYHLDNAPFVAYLRQQAKHAGVRTVDARIVDVRVAADGETVTALLADDGRDFAFDLYVDCSGFRSLLLEQSLNSPFLSYGKSLFTDRALVATVPHGGVVEPHTTATTFEAGWCWSTPQRLEDHRGYVFCSAFASPEAAEREMRGLFPEMGEPRLIEFRTGRHEHFWRGNVVAMGNAYGFVEPLESTALHMLIRQIGLLVGALPLRQGERGIATLLNRRVAAYWDYLCWFLALHYRFNRRLDSPFWQHCTEAVDISAHGELIEAYRERGPLSYQPTIRQGFTYPDPLWGAEGIDAILLGQRVPARLPQPELDRREWQHRVELYRQQAQRGIRQADALAAIKNYPEILQRWVAVLRRFGPAFGP
ncbi:MAG: tryptophan halogenase family protein [Acidobacteriota bacterium]